MPSVLDNELNLNRISQGWLSQPGTMLAQPAISVTCTRELVAHLLPVDASIVTGGTKQAGLFVLCFFLFYSNSHQALFSPDESVHGFLLIS